MVLDLFSHRGRGVWTLVPKGDTCWRKANIPPWFLFVVEKVDARQQQIRKIVCFSYLFFSSLKYVCYTSTYCYVLDNTTNIK
jgi:hypothetical protein